MTEEQLKHILEEQQKAGAPLSLLTQMRFAYELELPEEIYALLIQTEDFEIREWIRISVMEGIPCRRDPDIPQKIFFEKREYRGTERDQRADRKETEEAGTAG